MEKAFLNLIECVTMAPILTHFYPQCEYILETYASNFALGAVLSQKEMIIYAVFYILSLKKSSTVQNHQDIYDEELVASIYSFTIW
jgi:hypothetical protein